MDYKQKYLKYKQKYLALKGGWRNPETEGLDINANHAYTEDEKKEICPICIENVVDIKFIRCWHCVCRKCFDLLSNQPNLRCPECRNEITDIFRLNDTKDMWVKQNLRIVPVEEEEILIENINRNPERREEENIPNILQPGNIINPMLRMQ